MIFCSVDLAFSTTGLCISDEDLNILDVKKITTCYGEIKDKSEDEKIVFICDAIIALCNVWNVTTVILEDQFVGNNMKTAMQLNRVRGALTYAVLSNKMSIKYIPAVTVKKIVSKYAGVDIHKDCDSKSVIADCVLDIYSDNEIVQRIGKYNNGQNKSKTSDMYDAVALSVAYGLTRHKL